jgi:hypothetical protein
VRNPDPASDELPVPDDPVIPVEHRDHPLRDALVAAELETGRHEETPEEVKRSLLVRLVRIVAGAILLIVGIALLALPGPGWVTIFVALLLLSEDVPFARKLRDKVRDRLPQDEDGGLSTSAVVGMVGVTVLAIGVSVWWFFLR